MRQTINSFHHISVCLVLMSMLSNVAFAADRKSDDRKPASAPSAISYGDGLDTARKLSAGDPSNSQWQRDLWVSYNKTGDVQLAQGNLAGAIKSYGDGLDIARKHFASDPSNVQLSYDVVVSLFKLASLAPNGLVSDKAIIYLHEGRATLMRLNQQGKLTTEQKSLLPWFGKRLAELEKPGKTRVEGEP